MPTTTLKAPSLPVRHLEISAPCPWHLLNQPEAVFCWSAKRDLVFDGRDGTEDDVWFAIGAAREFASVDECQSHLRQLSPSESEFLPRGFALMAFDPSQPAQPPWNGFPTQTCVLPQILLRWRGGKMRATVWGNVDEVSLRKALASPPSATQSGRAETSEMTHVTRIKWRDMVREVQAQIGSETLKKAVIARSMTLTAQEPFDPADIIEALSMDAENCILFAYHQPDRGTFLGATPERLFHLQHNQLTVDSLAGTRPRGKNAEEDVNFSRELSESSKDKVEQEFVTRHILECLPSFAETVQASVEPRVRKLSSVQHLQTTVLAELKPRASLDGLVNALHPTPATCGVPADRARQMISELEPLPRGLYAGLIGWITADEAEFAVMIRSGLIQENTAHLFAGAGIVADSDPDAEYDECEWKMEPMRRAVSPRFSEGIKGG